MSVKLPKHLAGFKFDPLLTIEINGFDMDMVLPALFWLIRSGGKERGTRTDPKNIAGRTTALASHPKLQGFDDETGRRVLDKWVRSSLIRMSAVGRQRKSEQIAAIQPLTFLAYKPGFPTQSSRLRQVPQFLYHVLKNHLRHNAADRRDTARYFEYVQDTFARGVSLDDGRSKDGRYDGVTEIDLEVLLQLYYLDGFEPPQESSRAPKEPALPSMPCAASLLAQDVAWFLTVYAHRVPAATLARYLVALLNFELFIYTRQLMQATNRLVARGETPVEFTATAQESASPPPPDFYVDLTQVSGCRSDLLAHACVNRDLEEAENFSRSNLMLRTLHSYVEANRDLKPQLANKKAGEYILELWEFRSHADVRADSRRALGELEALFRGEDDNEENIPLDVRAILDRPGLDDLARVVEVLVLMQRKDGIGHLAKWIANVGGLNRTDGVVRGNIRGRRVWRYVMSDMLLETLVQLAVISPEAQRGIGERSPRPDPRSITLTAFLDYLRKRFGILIDAPPPFDASTEAIAAAKENFAALKQRLRQMGLFMDLSDDLNAQRIYPRFRKLEVESAGSERSETARRESHPTHDKASGMVAWPPAEVTE